MHHGDRHDPGSPLGEAFREMKKDTRAAVSEIEQRLQKQLQAFRQRNATELQGDPPEKVASLEGIPQEKLDPHDQGGVQVGITDVNGKVVIQFGQPLEWIGFEPDQAILVGQDMIQRAKKILLLARGRGNQGNQP